MLSWQKNKYELIPYIVLISLFLLSLLPFWCHLSSSFCYPKICHFTATVVSQYPFTWLAPPRSQPLVLGTYCLGHLRRAQSAFQSASQSAVCKLSYLHQRYPSTIMSVTVVLNFYFIRPVRKRSYFI